MTIDQVDTAAILREILPAYALPRRGHHGVVHWARVMENGLALAERTGARRDVVALFALFHDARRVNEKRDPGHGERGAELARALRGRRFDLDDEGLDLLVEACRLHTDGRTDGDLTIRACWDADRLDLGRVGVTPSPRLLCTDAARALLPWAHARAVGGHEPEFVRNAWPS